MKRSFRQNRNSERFFNCPATAKTIHQCASWDSQVFGPILETLSLTTIGNLVIQSVVAILFSRRSPSNIESPVVSQTFITRSAAIMSVTIWIAINRVLTSRLVFQDRVKRFKRFPQALTDCSSAFCVVFIAGIVRVINTGFHGLPRAILRTVSHLMFDVTQCVNLRFRFAFDGTLGLFTQPQRPLIITWETTA